jgi:hypothetical protein
MTFVTPRVVSGKVTGTDRVGTGVAFPRPGRYESRHFCGCSEKSNAYVMGRGVGGMGSSLLVLVRVSLVTLGVVLEKLSHI